MSKKALCVGVSTFKDQRINPLPGCVNDAQLLAETLQTHYGFSPDGVRLLTNEQATKAGVVDGLNWLVAGASRGDVLVFTVASHGTWTVDLSGDEEAGGRDEVEVTYDYDFDRGLGLVDDEIGQILDNVPEGARLYCIIDTCCSGTATRGVPAAGAPINRYLEPPPEVMSRLIPDAGWRARRLALDDDMNRISLSGCTDDESSLDYPSPKGPHGLMTYSLYQTLEAANWQGTVAEIFQEVQRKVSRTAKSYRALQTPQLHGPDDLRNAQLFG